MTPSIAIGLAQYSDSHEIADMSRTLIEHGLPWTWRPGRIAREIAAPNKNVVVARGLDRLVGFGIMEYLDEHAYLVLFAVQASTQRKGVGSAILHWLEASALVAGAARVRVEAGEATLRADASIVRTGTTKSALSLAATAESKTESFCKSGCATEVKLEFNQQVRHRSGARI